MHDYNTREKMGLHILPRNMNLFERSVTKVGIRLYNKVAVNIKTLNEYKSFKRELTSFLMNHILLHR